MNQRRPSPLVKWAGGKSSALAPILASAGTLPGHDGTYFEPFLGGAAAFLAIAPSRAVLSDTNAELIAMYEAVRDEPEALMRELDALQPYVADREYYYAERARAPQAMSRARAAARFIYLNKTCYNGLYRVNRRGQFNVPFGRYTTPPRLYDRENLLAVSAALGAAELVCADYRVA
ncbi:MAG TPA: Dam family site-specific DNA-(adenine-N6)-methyltransferase, partial [Dehalococcoidia bacterium]|nr:Dam family site-specific DNA-(adenine-N6)-methyltransferase [Dehalococcoidia bacterium]